MAYAALVVVALALLYLIPGAVYWYRTQPDVARCLWGNPECSLSLATFVLVLVTSGAFLAAFTAALYAYQTMVIARDALGLERSAILMIRRCGHDHKCSLHILVGREGVQCRAPSVNEQPAYYEMNFDFVSIGRTAIVKPVVPLSVSFSFRDTEKKAHETLGPMPMEIESLRVLDHMHATVWVESEVLNVAVVEWHEKGASQVFRGGTHPLECHGVGAQRPDWRAVLRWSDDIEGKAPTKEGAQAEEGVREVSVPEPSTPEGEFGGDGSQV